MTQIRVMEIIQPPPVGLPLLQKFRSAGFYENIVKGRALAEVDVKAPVLAGAYDLLCFVRQLRVLLFEVILYNLVQRVASPGYRVLRFHHLPLDRFNHCSLQFGMPAPNV